MSISVVVIVVVVIINIVVVDIESRAQPTTERNVSESVSILHNVHESNQTETSNKEANVYV